MIYKIGQKIKFTSDFTIDLASGKTARVKKGDEATVVKKVDNNSGEVIYNTGEAKGLSQILAIRVDDSIDEDSILKKILENLK